MHGMKKNLDLIFYEMQIIDSTWMILKILKLIKINVDSIDFISRVPNLTKLNVYKNCISEENVNKLEDMGITVYLMDRK